MADAVRIVEVAPRDGLQNESVVFDTDAKVELITRAVAAGIDRVEVASFVNPQRVPQMADAEAVCARLPRDGAGWIGLVLNDRGFDRALAAGLPEINVVVVVTETFSQRNQGMGTADAVAYAGRVIERAHDAGIRVGVTLSAAFGCPYEGEVPLDRLVEVAARVAAAGPDELALADTIGAAVPPDVRARLAAVRAVLPGPTAVRCHFHNTRSTGLANAAAAVEAGVDALDASLGGIGGCPFAPGATGNIPTEDLVHMLDRMGVRTGVDLDGLLAAIPWLEQRLGRPVPGQLSRAGAFPRSAA